MKLKKINIWFIVSILFILNIVVVLLWYYKSFNGSDNNKEIKSESGVADIDISNISVNYEANLIMVGDMLIHNSVYNDANRLAGYNGYDFRPQIKYIKEIVKDYDLAYYNQETILGGTALGLSNFPRFNSPQEAGDAMIDAGFNLVSLATNHTMDKNETGIINSRKYWNSKDNVQAVGSYRSSLEKKEVESKILTVNNIKYAMLNYTYGTNGIPVPSGKEYLVNVWTSENNNGYEKYKDVVKKDIEALRDKVDVLIVAMHWGTEYTNKPTSYQRDMAKFLADNNVDIVIGTHPHVIQPVEWIDDTIVFYSLGNFLSAQYRNQGGCYNYNCVVGLMSSLRITKSVDKNGSKIKIDNINNDLIYTYYDNNWKNFMVIPFSNPDIKKYLDNYQSVYDRYASLIKSDDERIKTVELGG